MAAGNGEANKDANVENVENGQADVPRSITIDVDNPTRWEKAIVTYPCSCCWFWFAFSMMWTVLAVQFFASETLTFDQNGVWDVRSHKVQKQFDAFMLARESSTVDESSLSQYTEMSQTMAPLHFLYYSEDGEDDFLSPENLKWMKEIEAKLLSTTDFKSKCVLTYGADSTQEAIDFASLDPTTNTVTADRAPANGEVLAFSGSSSVLKDGGLYSTRLGTAPNTFKVLVRDLNTSETEVVFSSGADISAGARFLPTKTRCSAAQSILSYAQPAVQDQTDAVCNGFVPSQKVDGVPVLTKLCGCGNSSLVNDPVLPCKTDCTGNFGKSLRCMSSAYVAPGADLSKAVVDANLAMFCPDAQGLSNNERQQYKATRQELLPKTWGCSATGSSMKANTARSMMSFGGPLKGYTRVGGEKGKDQLSDLADWAGEDFFAQIQEISADANEKAPGTARVVIMSQFMVELYFNNLMLTDAMLAFGSIWFVFMWAWCSTGSALLATGCIFETFVSLPMAMATWALFGQEYIGFLCVMMIFVILGVGADDVFVMTDAWKQSGQQGFGDDLQKRFSWAYRRARGAMGVTTMTTFFGFLAAGLSDVPSISGFGFFSALVVFWDFVMCITFYASLIVVYHKYFEKKNPCCCGNCTAHMCCCPCKCFGFEEPGPTWRKPKIMVPFIILLVLGFALAAFQPFLACLIVSGALIFVYSLISAQTDLSSTRPVERFFEEKYFPFAVRHKIKFLIFFAVLCVTCIIVVATQLRLPTKEDPFLSEHHPLQRYLDHGSNFGSSGINPLSWVYVSFGVDRENAIDRSGVDYQQPGTGWVQNTPDKPLGKVMYSKVARDAMVSQPGQNEIISVCDNVAKNQRVAVFDTGCKWVVYKGVGYPRYVPDNATLVASGHLKSLTIANAQSYYEVANGGDTLSSVSSGFCATGVYCFMYSIRDYLVSFCNPASGLKASWVASMGSEFSKLCTDASGNDIAGGPTAFPAADLDAIVASDGFRLYEKVVVRNERLTNGMAFDEFQRGRMTNKIVSGGLLQFAFVGINGTIPLGDFPYSEQKDMFDDFNAFFDSQFIVNKNAFFSCFVFNWMLITEALLRNTFQSMGIGIMFCCLIATLMTWNIVVGCIAVSSVFAVVSIAVAFICLMGWTLGIIEAIVLIVIVGISVDYSVHIAHAFNNAEEIDDVVEKIREHKSLVAVGTMGISLVSGMATSVGAATFLIFCKVAFFRKFGQFLVITLIISFLVTLFYLIPLFLVIGPVHGRGQLCNLATVLRRLPTQDDQHIPKNKAQAETVGQTDGKTTNVAK